MNCLRSRIRTMEIKKSLLRNFIVETALSGEHSITEVKLNFAEQGLELNYTTTDSSIAIRAALNKNHFKNYEAHGLIGINNYTELTKVLDSLAGDDLIINKEEHRLVFQSGSRHVEYDLADPELISHGTIDKTFEYDINFKLPKTFFSEIEKALSFSISKSEAPTIKFTGKNGVLETKYGSRYKFTDKKAVPEIQDELNVEFGTALFNAIGPLTGELNVSVKSNFPITVLRKGEDFAVRVLIAPRME